MRIVCIHSRKWLMTMDMVCTHTCERVAYKGVGQTADVLTTPKPSQARKQDRKTEGNSQTTAKPKAEAAARKAKRTKRLRDMPLF